MRAEQGMSVRGLARLATISPSFLSDIELGRRYPSDETLRDIATLLRVEFDALKRAKYVDRPTIGQLKSQLATAIEMSGNPNTVQTLINQSQELAAKDTRIAELKGALSRLLETHTFYTEHDKIAVDGIKDVLKGEPVDNKKDMAMPSPEHNALRNQADRLGWSYIRINAEGKLVGLPPPPANNQDLIEITAAVLEGKTDGA